MRNGNTCTQTREIHGPRNFIEDLPAKDTVNKEIKTIKPVPA